MEGGEGEGPRIGVYICHCGVNIAATVNVEEVAEAAGRLPDVLAARHYVYMCSQPGQALIKEDIRNLRLNRVIVASCSPRMHEPTFRRALEEAGINPFYFEMANIREQVSWAHMKEPERATEKAKDLIRMAVGRARLLEPVSRMEVGVEERALVVGAGVAGITAALDLAHAGFQVYLVEKEPYVGGHLALLNKLYWGGNAPEVLTSLTRQLSNPRIEVLTNSEVVEVGGHLGNFDVRVARRPRYVDERCNVCGKCAEVCPVSVPDGVNLGLSRRKAIYLPIPNCQPARYVLDRESCTGCGECLKACPVGAINLEEEPPEVSLNVGMVVVASGFEPYKPNGEYGYGGHRDVVTQLALERILSPHGPSGGELTRPSDGETPRSVAFIMCVGSRQEGDGQGEKPVNAYCSRFCCSSALKNASLIRERYPGTEVYVLYRDIRTFGRRQEEIYRRSRGLGVNFIRYRPGDPPRVKKAKGGRLTVTVNDLLLKVEVEILADLVVLVEGMIPRADMAELQSVLSLTRSPDGFFQEAHPKMNPLDTFTDGVFIGGTAQGPKDIIDTVSQASGAASKAAILLRQGKILLDLTTAVVDEEACTGCGKCGHVCPYKAIALDEEEGVAKVVDVKCKGCGSCSATCPVGAVQVRHHRDAQYLPMIEGLFPLLEVSANG